MRTFAAVLASHVKVVSWPRLIVVGFARNVIAGAAGGAGATGGGGGGGGGAGAAATLFLQPNASREAVRTTNATFLMREELIACLLVESYWGTRTMPVPYFCPCSLAVALSFRREAWNRSGWFRYATIRKRCAVHRAPIWVSHYRLNRR